MRSIRVIFLASLLLLLTAFGCRTNEDDASNENANTEPQSSVTFNIPETTTSTSPEVSSDGSTVADQNQEGVVTFNENTTSVDGDTNNVSASEGEMPREDIALAEKIVEIFGSFTNKSREPFKNVTDIEIYATDRFSAYLATLKTNPPDSNAPFYGITTRVLSSATLESTSNSSELLITTEREEVTEDSQSGKTSYVVVKVDMVKQDDEWKVNGIFWQ